MVIEPIQIFISYAHEDEKFKIELEKRLKPYERKNLIRGWTDRAIRPGALWDKEIKTQINEASVFLFLISPDFMASDYVSHVEIKRALDRFENGGVRIIPIIIRPTDLSLLEFSKFKALPTDAKPVSMWKDQDSAWQDVIHGLKLIFYNQDERNGNCYGLENILQKEGSNLSEEVKLDLLNLISTAKTSEVIDKLIELESTINPKVYAVIILLGKEYQKIKYNERVGEDTRNNTKKELTKINKALLLILLE